MPDNLNRLLKQARRAYKTGDRGKAAYLVDQILKQDYFHHGAWKLLQHEYGRGVSLQDFQLEFTELYHPDKLELLTDDDLRREYQAAHRKKVSLWKRIAAMFGRRPAKKESPASQPQGTLPTIKPIPPEEPRKPAPEGDLPTRPVTYLTPETPKLTKYESRPKAAERKQPAAKPKPAMVDDSIAALVTAASQPADKLPKIRVLVVDDTAQTRETIIRSLSFQREVEVVATAENGHQAIEIARQTRPDVVLMDVNMPDMDGISATAAILEVTPYTQVIILTVQNDPDYMRRAMMAGARDFLTKPPGLDDLLNAVQQAGKIAHQEIRKAAQLKTARSGTAPSISARGKIITVYSPKGGSGCSMVTANLGTALHNAETNVLIVDGNFQYGDITTLFNLQSSHTILDLATTAHDLDIDIVEEVVTVHESGIKILAPPGAEQAENVTSDLFIDILEYLSDIYPYMLVDTSSQLTDATLAALEASHVIILLVTADLPSVSKVRKFLDTLKLLKIDSKRILIVLNMYDKKQEILPEMIGKSLRHEIAAMIPKDERVVTPSINRGVPFMLKTELKTRPIARSVLTLAEVVREKLLQLSVVSEDQEKQTIQAR